MPGQQRSYAQTSFHIEGGLPKKKNHFTFMREESGLQTRHLKINFMLFLNHG